MKKSPNCSRFSYLDFSPFQSDIYITKSRR
nr:MAG TPA: hypothetical protein [Bacteriophage sp.]DAP45873.1 MAG TPA: hypothetical protein [Bacteriophage sp.]